MNGLPTPPPAYWAAIPWWGYLGFLMAALIVVAVIGPWVVQRARGAPSALESREKSIARREQAAAAKDDAELDRLRHELATAIADRDEGWNRGRGMEWEAHALWHDLTNLIKAFNSLLLQFQRLAAGKLSAAVAEELLKEKHQVKPLGPLPRLVEVEPKAANETKYQ